MSLSVSATVGLPQFTLSSLLLRLAVGVFAGEFFLASEFFETFEVFPQLFFVAELFSP